MKDIEYQLEGKPRTSPPIPIPSAPPHHYYIPPRQQQSSYESSDEEVVFVVEEVPRNIRNDDDDIDVCVVYLCAIIAFLVPFAGLVYICCLRSCFGTPPPFSPRKNRAYKILIIATLSGLIVDIILGSLFSNGDL